jgi:hypothetical protein
MSSFRSAALCVCVPEIDGSAKCVDGLAAIVL